MKPQYIIELFDKQHDIKKFTCGTKALDIYLKERASQDIRKKIAVVYIIREISDRKVIGYYTLSSSSIELARLPEKHAKKLPKYKAMPVILLGRLAIDIQYQGRKIGEYLLVDSLTRSYNLSDQIGTFAVLVEAKDENSRKFYEKYGFIQTTQHRLILYLPMGTIKKLIYA